MSEADGTEESGHGSALQMARGAMAQLGELTGRQVEGVVGIARSEEGWTVTVEVLEASRIPNTTDVLAEYEVELDAGGDLVSYHRAARYLRGAPRDE